MLISKFKKIQDNINIEELCEAVNLKLPEQYLNFLKKYNGGETPNTKWTGKGKGDVRGFYGYRIDNKSWDLDVILSYIFMEELIEKKMFPIATNSFGDVYCIKCEDESIWFIYHDTSQNKRIADDFNHFIKGCKSEEIGHIRTIEERKKDLWNNFGETPSEITLQCWQEEIDKYANIIQEEVILYF